MLSAVKFFATGRISSYWLLITLPVIERFHCNSKRIQFLLFRSMCKRPKSKSGNVISRCITAPKQQYKLALAVSVGGMLELYDFIIYALMASYIAEIFSPHPATLRFF